MRYGFTTGSCAAAAAKAAAYMLLFGKEREQITIMTPKGVPYTAKLLAVSRQETQVSCAVEKDSGDDPDITAGAWVYANVSYQTQQGIEIDGGIGVGRVTLPGLDQPVGQAAINHVPREMITKEVLEICKLADYHGGLRVEISVPEGERLAEKTFNPRLGIVGGISILGTSGIVEPMSTQALLDTIKVELKQRRARGFDYVVIAPGNYGQDFMKEQYHYDLDQSVKCSNFIGASIDMAVELGFQKVLLTGHLGKLIKVAGGIMNTHSSEADCRLELLTALAVREQVAEPVLNKLLDCVTTEDAVRLLAETGKLEAVMQQAMKRICFYLQKRAKGKLEIDCILFTKEYGELARSEGVATWFTLLAQEQEQ